VEPQSRSRCPSPEGGFPNDPPPLQRAFAAPFRASTRHNFPIASVSPVAAASMPSITMRPDTGPHEGASGPSTTAWYTILLSTSSPVNVGVDFHTENGTATGCASRIVGCDFQHISGRLTFQPGGTSKHIAIPVWGDDTPEDHETLLLVLCNASNATIAMVAGITDIYNDDLPIINFAPEPAREKVRRATSPTRYSTWC
jgi:hypothetical protein